MAQNVDEKLKNLVGKLSQDHSTSSFLKRIIYNAVRNYGISREDAEDILQNKLMQITTFDSNGRNPLEGYNYNIDDTPFDEDSRFIGWFKKIYQNACIDHRRRKRNNLFITGRFNENGECLSEYLSKSEECEPIKVLIDEENEDLLRTCMDKLYKGNREVLRLRFFEGYSYKKIAHKMQIPIGTVKSRHSNGIRQLREFYRAA